MQRKNIDTPTPQSMIRPQDMIIKTHPFKPVPRATEISKKVGPIVNAPPPKHQSIRLHKFHGPIKG